MPTLKAVRIPHLTYVFPPSLYKYEAARGARGGARGGIRGGGGAGRGGGIAPQTNGHLATSAAAGTDADPPAPSSTGPSWADAVAASTKINGISGVGGGNDWGDDTEGLNLGTSSSAPHESAAVVAVDGVETAPSAVAPKPASTAGHSKPSSSAINAADNPSTAAKTIPKNSKMSWAQIAR